MKTSVYIKKVYNIHTNIYGVNNKFKKWKHQYIKKKFVKDNGNLSKKNKPLYRYILINREIASNILSI